MFILLCPILCAQAQNVQKKSTTSTVSIPQNAKPSPPDTDGDGVPDYMDKELITATICQPVDADGIGKCPDPECCQSAPISTGAANGKIENELAVQKELLKTQAQEIQKLNRKLEHLTNIINRAAMEKTGLTIPEEILKLTATPNPANQYFNIAWESDSHQPVTIIVRDMVGRSLEERSGLPSKNVLQLGDNYPSGSYFIEARQGKERKTLVLVKQ